MNSESIAGTVGGYIGAAFITGLLTRVAVTRLQKRQMDRDTAGMVAFLLASVVVIVVVSLVSGFPQGFRTFVITYLPCLVLWLVFDLYKARTTPK
jgi:Ca2+/Na+ antiporter